MQLRAIAVAVAVASVAPFVPGAAFAAPSASEVEEAKKHFGQGVKLFEENDYKGALVEFRRAYQIAPNWQVLFNIGQCQYQLLDYPAALETFEAYLQQGGADVPSDKKATVQKDIEELKKRVAKITVDVDVEGAEVFVDDVSVGKSPLAKPVLVATGTRRFTARKPGRVEATKSIEIAGGDSLTVQLSLPATPAGGDEKRPVPTLAVVGFSTAGVGLLVGGVFGIMALAKRSDLGSICKTGASGRVCPSSADDDIKALSRDAWISNVGFGVALVGVGVGIFGLASRPASETAAPSAGIQATFGLGSIALSGRF